MRSPLAWMLLLALGACTPRETEVSPPNETTAPSTVTPLPRPYRARLDEALVANAECVSCHDDVAEEWRSSLHHRASEDPAYRAALDVENAGFCRGCHAPEADFRGEPDAALAALGVACVTCHVPEDGVVLAAATHTPGAAERAPHAVTRSPDFAGPGACAGCHEFRFPAGRGDGDEAFMQTTVREHARSAAADRPCAECHMPTDRGRRSHTFASVRDPKHLTAALRVELTRVERDLVRLTLAQRDPGHAFPTGDLFRRLEVGAELLDARGRLLRRETRHLMRHFEVVPGFPGRTLVRDDRLQGRPAEVDLELLAPPGGAPPAVIRAFVTYQRVAAIGDGLDPESAIVESEVPLFESVFSWENDR